jgi:multicomponent Na+:H+ antiporter subunit E
VTYVQDLAVGAFVALSVTWVVGRRRRGEGNRWLQPQRYLWAAIYAFVLAAYIVIANLEVAYRVLHPSMPIRPGIVKVKTRLRQPSARAALCNSITLTPGTLVVDLHRDGTLMVHWIYVRSEDEEIAAERIIGRFEWFIERIFE